MNLQSVNGVAPPCILQNLLTQFVGITEDIKHGNAPSLTERSLRTYRSPIVRKHKPRPAPWMGKVFATSLCLSQHLLWQYATVVTCTYALAIINGP